LLLNSEGAEQIVSMTVGFSEEIFEAGSAETSATRSIR
jgi:hypothetical protein